MYHWQCRHFVCCLLLWLSNLYESHWTIWNSSFGCNVITASLRYNYVGCQPAHTGSGKASHFRSRKFKIISCPCSFGVSGCLCKMTASQHLYWRPTNEVVLLCDFVKNSNLVHVVVFQHKSEFIPGNDFLPDATNLLPNIDLSPMVSYGIHVRTIREEMLRIY